MPNLTPIPAGTDPNQVTAMMNRNFQQLNNEQVTKLYNDANGTPSILVGLDSTGKSVIKVAKAGMDVTTATDADLAFNSAQNTLKVAASGTIPIPAVTGLTAAAGKFNTSAATTTVAHGLSFVPVVLGSVVGNGGGGLLPFTYYGSTGAASGSIYWEYFNVACDSTNIYFTHVLTGFGGTTGVSFSASTGWGDLRYQLLQETAN